MEVRRFDVNGGHRVERITRTDSHQFARERRSPPQRLLTPIIIILSSVTHMNGPTFISEGNLISSMPYHVIFAYLIPVLIGILGANTQGRTEPLLKTHAINMWGFIVAKAIYCFALAADIKSRLHRENSLQLSGLVAVVSGSVSAVSLITTFLLPSIGHIILYASWFFAATVVVLYQYGILLIDACRRFHYDTLKLLFTRIWNGFQNYLPETAAE